MKRFGLFGLCIVLSVLMVWLWTLFPEQSSRPGLIIQDWYQNQFPAPALSEIAMIPIDGPTLEGLAKYEVYFPFQRALHQDFLQSAKALGAKGVIFDIIFSENSSRGPEDDLAFASAIASSPFPVAFASDGVTPPAPLLKDNAKNLIWGDVSTISSADGIYRQSQTGTQSLAFRMATAIKPELRPSHTGNIHFMRSKDMKQEAYYNVLHAWKDPKLAEELRPTLNGKIWLVSYAAPGLLDNKPSPTDRSTSGTWLVANQLSEILRGSSGIRYFKTSETLGFLLAGMTLWILILLVVSPQRPIPLILISALIPLLFAFLTSMLLWSQKEIWMDPIELSLAMLSGTLFYFVVKVRRDWAERLRFADTIRNSMSKEMLHLIESGEIEVKRFGEKREICILFADLAGFTTLSEKLSPEILFQLMNEYLNDVVDLLMKEKAYVDKFIGDAVMAIWGAPVKTEADADSALRAALGFKEITQKCAERWAIEHGLQFPIYTRVGLHFGAAITGNLGASSRFNYTALGDSVNLASRLEGVGKVYHQELTVSGELLERASPEMKDRFFMVDRIRVKGKETPTVIYTAAEGISNDARMAYAKAFKLYESLQFREAATAFQALEDSGIGSAITLKERCLFLLDEKGHNRMKDGSWGLDEK
jgi:adenylate cyclase